MLDQLAIPAGERAFDRQATRIKAGVTLPPPKPVFPRYVEPEDKT
jgi:methionyl-tRNA synthetase